MDEQRPVTSLEAAVSSIKAEIEGVKDLIDEIDKRHVLRFELSDRAIEAALTSQEKAVSAALAAAEKAVQVAEGNSEKWRSNANEWRGAMDDREARMVMKEHLNPVIGGLQKEVNELKTAVTITLGRDQGYANVWGWMVAAAGSGGVIAWIVAHYTK